MTGHDIIVIGASAGGVGALEEVVGSLPSFPKSFVARTASRPSLPRTGSESVRG
jgi:chemotaxis response regulator CheB